MKNLTIFIAFLFFLTVEFTACKKEEVNTQEYVQKHILGRWPLKYTIKTVYTNNVPAKPDTIKYNPIDTLVFSETGSVVRRNGTLTSTTGYAIDAAGESITFNATPSYTQQFSFVRLNTIGLATSTTTTVGNTVTTTVIEDQLIK